MLQQGVVVCVRAFHRKSSLNLERVYLPYEGSSGWRGSSKTDGEKASSPRVKSNQER